MDAHNGGNLDFIQIDTQRLAIPTLCYNYQLMTTKGYAMLSCAIMPIFTIYLPKPQYINGT
jgi:hypothetical protein